jgi:RNA polymerase sigma-70 factor (ECF subfamily)
MGNDEDELAPLFAIPDSGPLPEELAERHDLQNRLQQAIQLLPPKYRTIVFLRYSSQLSFSEIGAVLHMPEATAKTYFQRAKPILRANLWEWAESVKR